MFFRYSYKVVFKELPFETEEEGEEQYILVLFDAHYVLDMYVLLFRS